MKKPNFFTFLLIVTLLFTFVSNTFSGWDLLTSPENNDLYGIYFKDVNNGICVRYWTSNGGQNWTSSTPPYPSGYAMMFPDPNVGWFTGAGIHKTTNFGINWFQQTNPASAILYGVYFINVNTGYACGEFAKLIKTTNGGTNWTLLTTPVSSSYYLNSVSFTDANNGYFCGYTTSGFPSIILKTTDGGTNWSVQNFPDGTGYDAISFLNSSTGIVIGKESAKTTDAGATWVSKPLPVGGFYFAMHFPSANTGYAVGFGGTIIKTTDSGGTWFQQTSPSGTLRSVFFINDNTGFACGNNGVVLKTTDGGGPPFGIQQISNEVPKDYSLSQNYPNPFNPSTNIEFKIAKAGFVLIKIYDITGNEIETLVNANLQPGIYKIDWNAANYSSGFYYYKLITSNYSESKKMVLIK